MQFTGFVTWFDFTGAIQGGGTLPQNGGQHVIDLGLSATSLAIEHRIGWTARQVERALSGFRDFDSGLAMVEIAMTVEATTVIGCATASIDVPATCARFDSRGRVVDRFSDRLLDTGLDAAGVQRESAPFTPIEVDVTESDAPQPG